MSDAEGERHLTCAIALFAIGLRGYVRLPDPVCHVCGQDRTAVVNALDPATLSVCDLHKHR
jgi:hypothetical protein